MGCCDINIDKTFILEPTLFTGETPTLTACTGVFTNNIIGCDSGNVINLGAAGSGVTIDTSFSATTVLGVEINKVKGGGWIVPEMDEIYNNPAEWYNKLKLGQYVIETPYAVSGTTSGTSQLYELININQFDNPTGWKRVVDNDTTISGYLSGVTIYFNTLGIDNAYSIDISKLDNEVHQLLTIINNGQTNVTFLPPLPLNNIKLKLFLNGVLQNHTLDYTISGTTITWLDSDFILNTTDLIKIIYI